MNRDFEHLGLRSSRFRRPSNRNTYLASSNGKSYLVHEVCIKTMANSRSSLQLPLALLNAAQAKPMVPLSDPLESPLKI